MVAHVYFRNDQRGTARTTIQSEIVDSKTCFLRGYCTRRPDYWLRGNSNLPFKILTGPKL